MCIFTQHTYYLFNVPGLWNFLSCVETEGKPTALQGIVDRKGEELVAHLTSDKEMLWTHTLDGSPGRRLGVPWEPHITHKSSCHRRACHRPGMSSACHLPQCL